MSDEDIDFERVITDPDYRRTVIEYLNGTEGGRRTDNVVALYPASGGRTAGRGGAAVSRSRPRNSQG